jgi:hypothetical protein
MSEDRTWVTINPETMGSKTKAAYAAYRDARVAAGKLKAAFEESYRAEFGAVPAGTQLIFGYNFGRLVVSLGEAKKTKAPATSGADVTALRAKLLGA